MKLLRTVSSITIRAGFLSLSTTDILLCRDNPVHCRMFSNIHNFYPLDAKITLFQYDNQNCL